MTGDPYLLLGVPTQAGDDEINKAYLQKVRQFPPERSPRTFEQIRAAYEAIRTRRDRLRFHLIPAEPPDLHSLVAGLLNADHAAAQLPSEELLLQALAEGLLEQNLNE